jgi:hypothetical protein
MTNRGWILLGAASVLIGCTPEGDIDVVNMEDPLTSPNGLTSNGLTSNGLTSNGLTSNGLTSNGLNTAALANNTVVLTALREVSVRGDNTRTFYRYLVSCALPVGKSVSYTWTDGLGVVRTEINPGGLGLAAAWETSPATTVAKEWVSACLAARTNSQGLNVPLSLRANGVASLVVSSEERAAYTYGEGAFWGNLFASTPWISSCGRSPKNVGASTSQYLSKGRNCASGDNCGVINYIGRCFAYDGALTGQTCYTRDMLKSDWVDRCGQGLTSLTANNYRVIASWLKP